MISATQASAPIHSGVGAIVRGEYDDARRFAREAVDLYAGAQSPWFHGNTLIALAEVSWAAGLPEEAAEAARARVGGLRAQGA